MSQWNVPISSLVFTIFAITIACAHIILFSQRLHLRVGDTRKAKPFYSDQKKAISPSSRRAIFALMMEFPASNIMTINIYLHSRTVCISMHLASTSVNAPIQEVVAVRNAGQKCFLRVEDMFLRTGSRSAKLDRFWYLSAFRNVINAADIGKYIQLLLRQY